MSRAASSLALVALTACSDVPMIALDPRLAAFRTADSLRLTGRYADAEVAYRRLADSLTGSGDPAALWHARLWWSEALLRTGRLDSARTVLDLARALATGVDTRLGWIGYMESLLLHREGRLDLALGAAGEALARGRAAGDSALMARGHSALGTVHSLSGRYHQAAAEAESALTLQRTLDGPPDQLAVQLSNAGVEYRHLGRLEDAERVLQEGLSLSDRLASPRPGMLLHGNLSIVRRMSGDLTGAVRFMEESLRRARDLGDVQFIALSQVEIGALYLRAGNLQRARQYLERSLEPVRRSGVAYNRLFVLEKLGRLELAERRPGPATEILIQARALADSTGHGKQRADVRSALARAAMARGDLEAARRSAEEAVRIAGEVGDQEALFDALEARAAARDAAGEPGAAESYAQAIGLLESWRGRLALGDLRMGVAESRVSVYEGAVRALIARGRASEAWEMSERARARLLLELVADRDPTRAGRSVADSLRQELRVRYEGLTATRTADVARFQDDLDRLTGLLAAVEADERRRDPAAAIRRPQPVTLDTARAGLLGPGRGLLAYFWGEHAVYGWWITDTAVQAVRLGSADSLAALVAFLRSSLERVQASADWRPAAHRAFLALIAPLTGSLPDDVVVLADGPLAHVPIEAFLPAPQANPLGATHRIVYGPSASVLLALIRARPEHPPARAVLAVGDPAAQPSAARAAALSGGRDLALGRLPHAAAEARHVHRLFRAEGAELLIGRRATSERWRALDPARYRYLHFAVHARVDDRRPEQTHLLLADGPLDLTAIRRLRLNADLVTLSACETALGRRVRGEGIIGLPHAFLSAGARAALVTLWRVDDRAAAELMHDFYRELQAGQTAAEALRLARRRRILSGDAAAHPSYWAPFVLVGVAAR